MRVRQVVSHINCMVVPSGNVLSMWSWSPSFGVGATNWFWAAIMAPRRAMARENLYRGGRLIRYFYSELDNRDLHSRDGREEVIMGAFSGWLLRNGAVERLGSASF